MFNPPSSRKAWSNLNTALKDVQSLVRNVDAQVKPLSAGLSETIRDTQKLVRNVDTQVASLGTNLNEAIGDGRKLIRNVDGSVDSVQVSIVDMIQHGDCGDRKQAEKVLAELQSTAKTDSILMYRLNGILARSGKISPVAAIADRLS